MINLKKNDKLIIIIAIVVVIIAAVGIVAYEQSDSDESDIMNNSDMMMYDVEWDFKLGSLSPLSDFASKQQVYETTQSISQGNLKKVIFNLSWVDDKATFFGRFGLDTVILEITDPDGNVYEESATSASRSKAGNINIEVMADGIPSTEPIEAHDMTEALEMLGSGMYYNDEWEDKEFTIRVGVIVGEKRILKKFMDKGNNFDLEISYEYYYGSLIEEEVKDTAGSDTDGDGDTWQTPYMSMIIGTGCGRFI